MVDISNEYNRNERQYSTDSVIAFTNAESVSLHLFRNSDSHLWTELRLTVSLHLLKLNLWTSFEQSANSHVLMLKYVCECDLM